MTFEVWYLLYSIAIKITHIPAMCIVTRVEDRSIDGTVQSVLYLLAMDVYSVQYSSTLYLQYVLCTVLTVELKFCGNHMEPNRNLYYCTVYAEREKLHNYSKVISQPWDQSALIFTTSTYAVQYSRDRYARVSGVWISITVLYVYGYLQLVLIQ